MLNRHQLKKFMNDPLMGCYFLKSRLLRTKLFNDSSRRSLKNKVSGLHFILSFDCDTLDDLAVVEEVNSKLQPRGINPVYAVPGELIEAGVEVYNRIRNTGAEFINHGYKIHTIKTETGKYVSVYDYDKLSESEMSEDIRKGHDTLVRRLNFTPTGFRTPHFGALQSRQELRFIHRILKEHNYRYSSSTIPYYGLRYGSVFNSFGVAEIPVTGLASEPMRIFDSFLYCDSQTGKFDEKSYIAEGNKLLDQYKGLKGSYNGIINLYADPSQIYASEGFFDMMERFASLAGNTTYEGLMNELDRKGE